MRPFMIDFIDAKFWCLFPRSMLHFLQFLFFRYISPKKSNIYTQKSLLTLSIPIYPEFLPESEKFFPFRIPPAASDS